MEHYFGIIKGFPAITELVNIKNGIPVKTSVTNVDLTRAIQHGNHSAVIEHMGLVWENCWKIFDEIAVLVFD